MRPFAQILADLSVLRQLGDVSLRYEPSMLIGETAKARRSWRPTLVWLFAVVLGLASLAALVKGAFPLAISGVASMAACLGGAVWLERRESRRRRFVLNFFTNTLRLDFATPIAHRPATMLVPFDDVIDVEVETQVDGRSCLVVTFTIDQHRLAEALVANIESTQSGECDRFRLFVRAAFGLGQAVAVPDVFDS